MTLTMTAVASDLPSSILSGSAGFLNYGPLGLAALMLVLVIITLLLRKVDQSQERLLKLCLYIGAFCFVAALLAQHFAPPDGSLDLSKQREILVNVANTVPELITKLQEISQMALADGCPGGPHGLPIPHGGDIASRSSAVMATLTDGKASIVSVIHSIPQAKRPGG